MRKITLEVNDKNFSEVLLILKSLKNGMITKIETDSKLNKVPTSTNTVNHSRYLSPEQFKQKLYKDNKS